jgi:hypothetical protein
VDECVTRTMAPRMADSGRGHHVLDSDSVLEAATGSRMPHRPRRARPSSSDSPGRRLPRLLPAMLGQPDRERVECSSRSLTGLHRVGETSRLVWVNSGSAHDASRRKTRETLESDWARLSVGARRGVRAGQHLHARGPGPAPAPRRGPVRGPRHAALGQRLPAPVRAPQAGVLDPAQAAADAAGGGGRPGPSVARGPLLLGLVGAAWQAGRLRGRGHGLQPRLRCSAHACPRSDCALLASAQRFQGQFRLACGSPASRPMQRSSDSPPSCSGAGPGGPGAVVTARLAPK